MTRFHGILLFCVLFISLQCKKEDQLPECPDCNFTCIPSNDSDVVTNDCKSNYTCTFEIHSDAKLQYSDDNFFDYIEPGDNLVFLASLDTEGAPHVADDEFTDLLYFELGSAQESFSVEDGDLDLLNVRFQQLCFCADVKTKKPVSGCMQGQRIDDEHWKVQANLVIQYPTWTKAVKVDAVFTLKP